MAKQESKETTAQVPYVRTKTSKEIWFDKCKKAGLICDLKKSVLMFGYTSDADKMKVYDFLGIQYSRKAGELAIDYKTLPPFSFGFCSQKMLFGGAVHEAAQTEEPEQIPELNAPSEEASEEPAEEIEVAEAV